MPEADLLHKVLTARTVAFQMQAGIHLSNDHHEAFLESTKPDMSPTASVSATGAAEAMIARDVLTSLFEEGSDLYTLTFDIQLA